ncbi:MAG: hypothetical protein ACOCRX_10265 [Candidatus Woesearchaeota archaeon]
MKKFLKWFVIVVVILGIIGAFINGDDDDLIEIELEEEITIQDEVVNISGETNFEDGTLISYEIDNYETAEFSDDEAFVIDGDMEVNNGEFNDEINISDEAISGHTIKVWVGFRTALQPEELQEKYGEEGENLEVDIVEGGQINIAGQINIVETFDFQ